MRVCAAAREAVGMEIPLSMDHLGHLGVNSIIRLGKAYEKYNLAWMEDVIPWQYTDMLAHITAESPTPILTGEDIYLKEDFINLCEKHAVSKIHPDISTSGGILETHKIGDGRWSTACRWRCTTPGLPIGAMASVHCAAATENFLACENHSLDVPWWQDLVEGIEKPIINKGFIKVPDKPGLGITLNEDAVRQHLAPGTGYFEPTTDVGQRTLRRPIVEHGAAKNPTGRVAAKRRPGIVSALRAWTNIEKSGAARGAGSGRVLHRFAHHERLAIGPRQHGVGLGVCHELLAVGVEFQRAAQPE